MRDFCSGAYMRRLLGESSYIVGTLLLSPDIVGWSVTSGRNTCAKHERRMPLSRCPVLYSASGEPVVTSIICHCRDCQRQTGSAFVEVVAVPKEAFLVQGRLQTFTNAGDSGRKLDRKFCPRCGSAVFVEAEGFPGMALIMGGSLDDTSWLKPTM